MYALGLIRLDVNCRPRTANDSQPTHPLSRQALSTFGGRHSDLREGTPYEASPTVSRNAYRPWQGTDLSPGLVHALCVLRRRVPHSPPTSQRHFLYGRGYRRPCAVSAPLHAGVVHGDHPRRRVDIPARFLQPSHADGRPGLRPGRYGQPRDGGACLPKRTASGKNARHLSGH